MKGSSQNIAIVGSGIAGLTAAHLLSRNNRVTVFEAADYAGGHTHTVPVTLEQAGKLRTYQVDTGFIVCNDRNYPNFLKLLSSLGVSTQPTEMSFSVLNPALGLEYNGHNLDTLFAQRSNLLKPRFIRFVLDILRFNKAAKARASSGDPGSQTLNDFLGELKLSPLLRDNYLLPMVAAIWSCSVTQAGDFPLDFFLRFFLNHGLLDIKNRPQWHVLKGGSNSYIEPLTAPFKDSLLLNTPVTSISRRDDCVELVTAESARQFDQVIVACHSDQALALLSNPSTQERAVLSNLLYQENDVTLHWDTTLMPKRKKAWASWNFLAGQQDAERLPVVTYSMNILQEIGSIHDEKPLLVSLNANDLIAPDKVVQRFRYAHPVYSLAGARAQQRRSEICGVDRIHYCGAYWYNGFHEDGVRSALDVCARFGETL
ncbi:MAG: FAD-dependent oxidoreductase [Gammaproteobacteria bacterium]